MLRRAVRVAVTLAIFWLVIVHGVALPRLTRAQLQLPQQCADYLAAFSAVTHPVNSAPGQQVDVSVPGFDTTKCPNVQLRIRARAVNTAGNAEVSTPNIFTIANATFNPVTRVYAYGQIWPGFGAVELTVSDTKRRQFGLSLPALRFEWSVAVQRGEAMVIERNLIVARKPVVSGDTVRLQVNNGTVSYLHKRLSNPAVEFYRSAVLLMTSADVELTVEDAQTVVGYLTVIGGSVR